MGLLDGELQTQIGAAVDFLMLDATITRYGTGAGDYTCRGFRDDESSFFEDVGVTRVGDLTVLLLQESTLWSPSRITPKAGDTVTVQGATGVVKKVYADPANATWLLDCTKHGGSTS